MGERHRQAAPWCVSRYQHPRPRQRCWPAPVRLFFEQTVPDLGRFGPLGAVWCVILVRAIATVIRSCRSHERSRRCRRLIAAPAACSSLPRNHMKFINKKSHTKPGRRFSEKLSQNGYGVLLLFRTHMKVCVCTQHLRPACSCKLIKKACKPGDVGLHRELPNPSPDVSRRITTIILITTPPLVIRNGKTGMSNMTQPLPNTWTRVNHEPREVCRSFFCLVEFFSVQDQKR